MTLLARLGEQLPERNYLGIDVGYTILAQGKEHVAVAITLQSFAHLCLRHWRRQDGDRWKRTPCLHFPSTRSGLEKLQEYLDGFSIDPETFLGICEPTGGFPGLSVQDRLWGHNVPVFAGSRLSDVADRERHHPAHAGENHGAYSHPCRVQARPMTLRRG